MTTIIGSTKLSDTEADFLDKTLINWGFTVGLGAAMRFMEETYGKVNAQTIELRKFVYSELKKSNEALNNHEGRSVTDLLMENICGD